jgi:hypothetical protein
VLERRPEEPLQLAVAAEAAPQLVDPGRIWLPVVAQHLADQRVAAAGRLDERRDLPEDEQVSLEDERAAPLVVERSGQDVQGSAQGPVASACFGVSFFGSMNGFSTTTASVLPSGRSTSSSVPSSPCSVGTIAKPMFFSSRGE